jgi:hypothetical protein|tara:strand:- start:59 stop:307 length:249 start_codon:yes stop_codon:yes gene_type:complete
MRVRGAEVALATGTTKLDDTGAVWVFNTGSAGLVTVRNAADNADVGSIRVGAGAGIILTLGAGEGLRGASTIKGTPIVAVGF